MQSLGETLRIGWRIVADVAVYRVRKREAGNLVTSLSLAVALGLSGGDIAVRALFGVLLNLWVYLVNDCFDVPIDLRAPGRDVARTEYLAAHLKIAWGASVALWLLTALVGIVHSRGLVLAAGLNAIVIVGYSAVFKRMPVLDLLAMTAWGLAMALVGFPLGSHAGWRFAGLLAILCTVTEAVQVLRDAPSDRAADVRTTAVVLGDVATAYIARTLIVLASLYATAMIDRALGPLLLLALLVPLRPSRASKSWDAFRAVFGATWLLMLARFVWQTRFSR